MASEWKPPPGQIMTAVPVALDGCGRTAVSVGCVTLRTVLKLVGCGVKVSSSCWFQSSDPGAPLGHKAITSGWSTLFIDVPPCARWMAVPAYESRRTWPDRGSGLLPVLIALPAH